PARRIPPGSQIRLPRSGCARSRWRHDPAALPRSSRGSRPRAAARVGAAARPSRRSRSRWVRTRGTRLFRSPPRNRAPPLPAAPPSTPPRPRRPSGGWRCAATGTVSTASSRFRRYRITGGLEKGTEKLMRPSVADHGRARAAWPRSSRLAAFQLRLGPRLVLRAVALRLHPRLALGGRSLPPWLGARWLGALLTRRLRGTSPWGGLGRGVGLAASLAGAVPVTLVALAAGAGPR